MTESTPHWQSAPRIGIGTDRHRLVAGRPCILGGVTLDCPVGPDGHSDADAVLHAVCDALLGAAGLDDLGTLFPDTDAQWKGAASSDLLAEVVARLRAQFLATVSLDIVVHCDRPKIGPSRTAIRSRMAELLDLPLDRVNVKGKTLEGAGGEQEYVDVTAVALVSSI